MTSAFRTKEGLQNLIDNPTPINIDMKPITECIRQIMKDAADERLRDIARKLTD